MFGHSERHTARLLFARVVPSDARPPFPSFSSRDLDGNMLTSLPDDVFADLTSLEDL